MSEYTIYKKHTLRTRQTPEGWVCEFWPVGKSQGVKIRTPAVEQPEQARHLARRMIARGLLNVSRRWSGGAVVGGA